MGRAGDTAAFDIVYDQFNRRLFGFLARLARSRDVAEDLLEETWLRFVANAARLDEDTRLGPWLFTVARNLHVSYCRSRAFEEPDNPELLSLWPSRWPQSPFEQAAFGELERRIEAALATLPVALREVLLLVGIEGLRPQEAAIVCGITPEALRQRLKRARDTLAALRAPHPTSTFEQQVRHRCHAVLARKRRGKAVPSLRRAVDLALLGVAGGYAALAFVQASQAAARVFGLR